MGIGTEFTAHILPPDLTKHVVGLVPTPLVTALYISFWFFLIVAIFCIIELVVAEKDATYASYATGAKVGIGICSSLAILLGLDILSRNYFMTDNRWLSHI